MCAICGCSGHVEGSAAMHEHEHEHGHGHEHEHEHEHEHGHGHGHGREQLAEEGTGHGHAPSSLIRLEERVLARNDAQGAANRRWLSSRRIVALNLVSSPGAGKTSLLERTVRDLGRDVTIQVIEGDQETDEDARRLRAAGARAVQLNTGRGCHLDARMVERGLRELAPDDGALVLIENVGNLVCPAMFDLGEHAKVIVSSVTEGEDKPIKYPHMFRAGSLVLLNKVDLLPHVSFDVPRFMDHVRRVNPGLDVLQVSATRGDGLRGWYDWLAGWVARAST